MWHIPESVKQDLAIRVAERKKMAEDLALQYMGRDLKAGYKGRKGKWQGVIKYADFVVFTCDCYHHNRGESTQLNGRSATDCARELISMCLRLQFDLSSDGEPNWSIDNARRQIYRLPKDD
jgi:hypothetical protein